MAVLVQYNDYDSLTLEELVNYTGISQDILKQVLAVLTKAKILLQDKEDDPYDLNPSKLIASHWALYCICSSYLE